MFQITTDERSGIIRTSAQGLWSIAKVDAFFLKLAERVKAMRLAGRPIRILSEVVEAAVQTPEIEARILEHAARLYKTGDRRALVVKNSRQDGRA